MARPTHETPAVPTAGLPADEESVAQVVEVCARHADALAGQVEAALRAVAAQLGQLDRGQVEQAVASGCWVASALRVVAASLGELHTVLDETALTAHAQAAEDEALVGVPVPAPRRGRLESEGGK